MLTAVVTPGAGPMPGLRIEIDYARHHWPGADVAHTAVAEQSPDNPTRWVARPVRAAGALRADSLFYRWRLSYLNLATVGGARRTTLTSAGASTPHEMTVGCSARQTEADLISLQAIAVGFDRSEPYLSLLGSYPVPTHNMVSVRDIGFTLGRVDLALMQSAVRMGPPSLLFFRPRPRDIALPGVRTIVPVESRRQYLAKLADPFPDPPYSLIGWAFSEPQRNARRRPSLGCVPSKHWFLHEAGYHLANGGFAPTPPVPPEPTPGARRIFRPADTPLAVVQSGGPPYFSYPRPAPDPWHPRIWDLHMWLDPRSECASGGCLPVIQIASPAAFDGIDFPTSTFFRSETFE